MLLGIVWIALAACFCNIFAANIQYKPRQRITDGLNTDNNARLRPSPQQQRFTNRSPPLNLPPGFNPQQPPYRPLLYPFHPPTRPAWKPIVQKNNKTHRIIPIPHPPILEDRIIDGAAEDTQFIGEELLLPTQSIIYGHRNQNEHKAAEEVVNDANQQAALNLTKEALEALLIGQQLIRLGIDEQRYEQRTTEHGSTMAEQPKFTPSKIFQRKIPKIVQLESDNPKFTQMAEQINRSEERSKYPYVEEKENSFRETGNWMPIEPTESAYEQAVKNALRRILSKPKKITTTTPMTTATTTKSPTTTPEPTTPPTTTAVPLTTITVKLSTTAQPMNWPADFESMEHTPYPLDFSQEMNATYQGDNSELPNYYDDLSLMESLAPQLAVNITKVGIPYEEKNSAEEPTICVPLTVSETIQAHVHAMPEIIEVERVYCFPLPLPDLKVKIASMPTVSSTTSNISQPHTKQTNNAAVTLQISPALYFLISVLLWITRAA